MADATITTSVDGKGLSAVLAFTDDHGNVATPFSAPTWTSSNTAVATATAAVDGMSAAIAPVGPVGTADITVVAEGDVTPGVDTVTLVGTVTLTAGEIKQGTLVFATV